MKTLRIKDDIHELITSKVDELEKQYGISITMESIADSILRNGIPNYDIFKKWVKETMHENETMFIVTIILFITIINIVSCVILKYRNHLIRTIMNFKNKFIKIKLMK